MEKILYITYICTFKFKYFYVNKICTYISLIEEKDRKEYLVSKFIAHKYSHNFIILPDKGFLKI